MKLDPNDHGDCRSETTGMSLRQWYAGQAMLGLLASLAPGELFSPKGCGQQAVSYADALIAELDRLDGEMREDKARREANAYLRGEPKEDK